MFFFAFNGVGGSAGLLPGVANQGPIKLHATRLWGRAVIAPFLAENTKSDIGEYNEKNHDVNCLAGYACIPWRLFLGLSSRP